MNIFELVGKVTIDGINTADKQLSGLQDRVRKASRGMKIAGTAMTAAGGAIVGGLALSLKAAVDFESAMREVNTMMGLSKEDFTDLSKQTQTLAGDLGVDAVDSAKALYQAISAGVPKENVIDFLSIATKAAIGGVTDTETAVDGLTTVINAFKLPIGDAQKVADLMFTTVKGGKTTFEELSASLFHVAPVAAASGIEFSEISAALATMTKQGVPTKVATTQLRQAILSMQKPSTEMATAINNLGFESGQAMVEEIGLAESLNLLRDSTGGSNEMLMTMFGSVEAGAAVLALTGDNAAVFATDLDAMANSTGAASAAFAEMEESSARQMDKLKASFKDVFITVGTAVIPALTSLVDKIKPIIENVRNWMEENPKLTKTIITIVGIIGGLLVVLGPILIMLPGIISALPLLGAAFAVLTGPVGLVIAAIVALVFAGKALADHWETLWRGIKRVAFTVINGIIDVINSLIRGINKIPGVNIGEISQAGTMQERGEIGGELTDRTKSIMAREAADPSLRGFATGGLISEPTLLYGLKSRKVYAKAGESGMEHVGQGLGGESNIVNNFNGPWFIREEADIPKLAREFFLLQQKKVRATGG